MIEKNKKIIKYSRYIDDDDIYVLNFINGVSFV